MLSFLRGQLRVSNLLVVASLVFAMAGGAFAATGGGRGSVAARKGKGGYVITSIKQIKPSVRSQLTGARGPQGEKGQSGNNGASGSNGQSVTIGSLSVGNANCPFGGASFAGVGGPAYACDGAEGKPGKEGKPGESVSVTPLVKGSEPEPSSECKELGGAKFTNNSGSAFACNGESAGSELKKGETERGVWGAVIGTARTGVYIAIAPITFQRPVAAGLATHVITEGNPTTECPGSSGAPEATEGNMCIYVGAEAGVTVLPPSGTFTFGVNVFMRDATAAEGYAEGSWAVTG